MKPAMPLHWLLAEYTRIINAHGTDSAQAREFCEQHSDNQELIDLCETAYWLKKALTAERRKRG
jgi:hypothetical protein